MDKPDLSKAKETATREDWDYRLPQYDKEADDGAGPSENIITPSELLDALQLEDDPWDKHSSEDLKYEFDAQSDYIEGEPGESDVRSEMGSLENIYDQAGQVEAKLQRGEFSKSAKLTLAGLPGDVKELGDRTTLVDLSYLKSGTERRRTACIIERIIKVYSAIPGTVSTEMSGKRGVYRFHVTNEYLSPARTRTPSPTKRRAQDTPTTTPKSIRQSLKIIPELNNGIILSPRYPGLPKCVLKYGTHGITPELIATIQSENPELTLNQVLRHGLSQTSRGKKVINMYNLPS